MLLLLQYDNYNNDCGNMRSIRESEKVTVFLPIRDNTNILGEVTHLKYLLASQSSLIKQMFYWQRKFRFAFVLIPESVLKWRH